MKRLLVILIVVSVAAWGCSRVEPEHGAEHQAPDAVQTSPHDSIGEDHDGEDAHYTCPMHPEVDTHDADARCPDCGYAFPARERCRFLGLNDWENCRALVEPL